MFWPFAESGKTKVLFVKNLPYGLTKEELKGAFDGSLEARIAMDRETQQSKG